VRLTGGGCVTGWCRRIHCKRYGRRACDGLRIEAILHDVPFKRCEQLQNRPLEISE